MAQSKLHLHGILPGAHAIHDAFLKLQLEGQMVTSFSESKLKTARDISQANLNIEWIPFSELVGQITQCIGQSTGRLATQTQLEAVIHIVCEDLTESSFFYQSRFFPGLHRCISKTLMELHQWGYTNHQLGLFSMENTILTAKMQSLFDIETRIREIFEKKGIEFLSDRIHKCLKHQPSHPLPIQKLFVLSGSEEYPLFTKWLNWITIAGVEVHILMEQLPDHPEFFQESFQYQDKIKPLISKKPWYSALFSQSKLDQKTPEIWKISAPDPLAECEWALRGCIRSIHEGAWPHKIGIFVRDAESYGPLLVASAKRLGVPIHMPLHAPLLSNGLALFILELLETLSSEDIRKFIKLSLNSYIITPHEKCEDLHQNLLRLYRLGDQSWKQLDDWAHLHQTSYPWLFYALSWKKNVLDEPKTFIQWHEKLHVLLEGILSPENIMNEASLTKERDLRAQTVLLRSVADHALFYEAKHDIQKFSFEAFTSYCKKIWNEEKITFPTSSSGIIVSNNTESLQNLDSLYVLNMLEGVIPKRRIEDPILNDEDRTSLHHHFSDLPPLKDSFAVAKSERDLFIRLCSAAEKKLVFSYPQTDETRDNVPAFYLTELEKVLAEKLYKYDYSRKSLTPSRKECLSPADIRLFNAFQEEQKEHSTPQIETQEARKAILRDLKNSFTPEEIGQILTCPFHATFKHHLHIYPEIKKNLWHQMRKLPALIQVSKQNSPENAKEALNFALNAMIDEHFPSLSSWEIAVLATGAKRLLDEWVEREFLSRKLWPHTPSSYQPNVALNGPEFRHEIPVGDKKIKLKGSVDGLSVRGDYSIVHFFESSLPDQTIQIEDPNWFSYCLYLLIQYGRKPGLALEIDSMSGGRILALLPRFLNANFPSKRQNGLHVKEIDFEPSDLFRQLKIYLKQAIYLFETGSVEPKSGKHCQSCHYGELCRSSLEFGESSSIFESHPKCLK